MRIWGTLTNSAYCDVDELPPHMVEVEIEEKEFIKLYNKFICNRRKKSKNT